MMLGMRCVPLTGHQYFLKQVLKFIIDNNLPVGFEDGGKWKDAEWIFNNLYKDDDNLQQEIEQRYGTERWTGIVELSTLNKTSSCGQEDQSADTVHAEEDK